MEKFIVTMMTVAVLVMPQPAEPQWTMYDGISNEKTYMDYRTITDETSDQWDLIYNELEISESGFLFDEEGNVAVALGSHFGEIGSKWEFLLDDQGHEKIIAVIKTDEKQDRHTKGDCITGLSNDVLEFVVDPDRMPTISNGLAYDGNMNNYSNYKGYVIGWRKNK